MNFLGRKFLPCLCWIQCMSFPSVKEELAWVFHASMPDWPSQQSLSNKMHVSQQMLYSRQCMSHTKKTASGTDGGGTYWVSSWGTKNTAVQAALFHGEFPISLQKADSMHHWAMPHNVRGFTISGREEAGSVCVETFSLRNTSEPSKHKSFIDAGRSSQCQRANELPES